MPKKDTVRFDGDKLGRARTERLLTTLELARRAKVSESTVRAARSGRPTGVTTAKRIAAALRVPLKSLLSDGGNSATKPAGRKSAADSSRSADADASERRTAGTKPALDAVADGIGLQTTEGKQ